MKRGNIDKRRAEKRSAVGGVLLFGLFQLALRRGIWRAGCDPGAAPLAGASVHGLGRGLSESDAPRAVGANIRIKEIGRGRSDLDQEEFDMLLVNIDYIPGKDLEVLGIVKGTVVQSKNFGKDFMAGMKTLVGGEITGYTEMLNEARQIAVKRMVDEAESLGADAVINIRYGSSSVMQGAAEVISYGTAVKYR